MASGSSREPHTTDPDWHPGFSLRISRRRAQDSISSKNMNSTRDTEPTKYEAPNMAGDGHEVLLKEAAGEDREASRPNPWLTALQILGILAIVVGAFWLGTQKNWCKGLVSGVSEQLYHQPDRKRDRYPARPWVGPHTRPRRPPEPSPPRSRCRLRQRAGRAVRLLGRQSWP